MSVEMRPALTPLFLVGATAVGKSELALALARKIGGAILSMDAMQVYRGADIGTGKPTASERAEIPHGGLDLADFGAGFDVAQSVKHAEEFLRGQSAAGRRVIIVGGTGLYFRALTRGLCEAPQGSDELRAELAALSTDALRARLEKIDPAMLAHLDAANPRRLARAIEVMETTGRSLRAWQEETPEPLLHDFRAFWLQRDKAELEARIAARVAGMYALGWAEEVRGLIARHGAEAVRAFPGIGYREITGAIGSGAAPESAQRDIIMATRQYAKRQLTWFNREPILSEVMVSGAELSPSLIAPFLS